MFELKERAKWSFDIKEKKLAITGMLSHGTNARSSLEEIFAVSAYEEIRAAAIDAIKSISVVAGPSKDLQISEDERSGVATKPSASKDKRKQEESGPELVASEKLADLPP